MSQLASRDVIYGLVKKKKKKKEKAPPSVKFSEAPASSTEMAEF